MAVSYYFKAGMIDPTYVARAKRQIEETGEPYFGSPTKTDTTRLRKMIATATPRRSGATRRSDDCVTAVRQSDKSCSLVCINWSDETGYTWRDLLESRYIDLKNRKARAKALDAYGLDESDLDYDIPRYTLAEIDAELAVITRVPNAYWQVEPILDSPFFIENRTNVAPLEADLDLGHFFHAGGAPGMSYEGLHASSFLAVSLLHYCIEALGSSITLEYADDYPDL